jgi:septal ring factor EnvC (AmiA/AmiB activator)
VITNLERLTLQLEVAELRAQLAESQEQCVELAVDAGDLRARIEGLTAELARVREERDAWRGAALRLPNAGSGRRINAG